MSSGRMIWLKSHLRRMNSWDRSVGWADEGIGAADEAS